LNKCVQKHYFLDDRKVRNEMINSHQLSAYEFACSFNLLRSVVNSTA